MLDFRTRQVDINKLEFWGATSLYIFSIFMLVSNALNGGMLHEDSLSEDTLPVNGYSYFANYLFPTFFRYTVFYTSYLLLVMYILPNLLKRKSMELNILGLIAVFITIAVCFTVIDTWLKPEMFAEFNSNRDVYAYFFKSNIIYSLWLMMMFAVYTIIKKFALYLLSNSENLQAKYQLITRDGLVALIIWMTLFFLLLITDSPPEILGLVGVIIPFSIALYWYSLYSFIPRSLLKKRKFLNYLWKVVMVLAISVLPLILLLSLIYNNEEAGPIIMSFNAAFQLLITVPLSWYIYKHRISSQSELVHLKTALGVSTANLHLLKSQINPHFLFNALNTLYGTALQENADRTSEGIQRLGDMMRFMLEENIQDHITLNREIQYITNYISLQKLRTQNSEDIVITTNITEHANNLAITPMLLIPFIENAFKHGISLREPSHIKITLQVTGSNLYFDVYNSIHLKSNNDPEKDKSGIGLNNVKQRLLLFYPNKHELIIRENVNEFFVHLTLQLDSSGESSINENE